MAVATRRTPYWELLYQFVMAQYRDKSSDEKSSDDKSSDVSIFSRGASNEEDKTTK